VCAAARELVREHLVKNGREAAPSGSQVSGAAVPGSASASGATPRTLAGRLDKECGRRPVVFFDKSGAGRTRQRPRAGALPGTSRCRAKRGAWSSRPCRRKARLLTDKVTAQAPLFQGYDTCTPFFTATPTERNGTCRRMSLPGERAREGAPCYFFFASVSAASFASFMALSIAFLVGSTGRLSCPAASR
jgi:hypothetical protein